MKMASKEPLPSFSRATWPLAATSTSRPAMRSLFRSTSRAEGSSSISNNRFFRWAELRSPDALEPPSSGSCSCFVICGISSLWGKENESAAPLLAGDQSERRILNHQLAQPHFSLFGRPEGGQHLPANG